MSTDLALGVCQENTGNLKEAVQTYESMLPYTSSAQASFGATAEHRRWTERLLARYCLLSSRYVKSKSKKPKDLRLFASLIAPTSILAPFRAWAEFWETRSDNKFEMIEGLVGKGDISRKLVWQAYYDTLSLLLQIESTYPSTSTTQSSSGKGPPLYEAEFFSKPKSQQCIELKRIESIYEQFLLNELKFPKANDNTPEIENWVDQVIANWKVLCGNTWLDEDHVDGGKASTGRKVLAVCDHTKSTFNILYLTAAYRITYANGFWHTLDPIPGRHKKLSFNSNTATSIHGSCSSRRFQYSGKGIRYLLSNSQ